MGKRTALSIMAVIFILACAAYAHGRSSGKLFISTDKGEYRAGDVIAVTITFDNVNSPLKPGKELDRDSFASIPELTYEDGKPVKKVPLYREKAGNVPGKRPANGPFSKGNVQITVSWKVERKVWRNEATGEVIYDGIGMEAGLVPQMGSYLYMLEKVPGRYSVKLNWVIDPVVNRSDYSVELDKSDTSTSNTVNIGILPAGK